MRKFLLALLPTALLLSPAAAFATTSPGYVTGIITLISDHSVLFTHNGNRPNYPGCANNNPTRWALDVSTPFGQAELAVMQTAAAQHKQVLLDGTGDCYVHADTETVSIMQIVE